MNHGLCHSDYCSFNSWYAHNLGLYDFFFESEQFTYSVRNVHSRETEQHYLNIVM